LRVTFVASAAVQLFVHWGVGWWRKFTADGNVDVIESVSMRTDAVSVASGALESRRLPKPPFDRDAMSVLGSTGF